MVWCHTEVCKRKQQLSLLTEIYLLLTGSKAGIEPLGLQLSASCYEEQRVSTLSRHLSLPSKVIQFTCQGYLS